MTSSRLQRELKKKLPFESPEQETVLNILQTNDRSENRFGRLCRPYGLTSSQYNVLRNLRGEGNPMPCLEIGEMSTWYSPTGATGYTDFPVDAQV